jgi:uncharacterized Tic20 family protein
MIQDPIKKNVTSMPKKTTTQEPEQEFIKKEDSNNHQGFNEEYNVWGTGLPKPLPKDSDSKSLATICHLSMYLPIPIIPVAFYLLKKNDPFIHENAKEDINFYIQFAFLVMVANALRWFLGIGYLLGLILFILYVVGVAYMAISSSDGKIKRYPFIVRWLK